MREPKIELHSTIQVEGKEHVTQLVRIVGSQGRSGRLTIEVAMGGASSAKFEEKILTDEKS